MPHRSVPDAALAPALRAGAGAHRHAAPVIARWAAALFVLLVAAMAALVGALPASAQEQLVSSTPAEGDVLDEAPTEIVLTFSGEVESVGIEMQLTDYHGTMLNLPTVPNHDGATVTQQFPELEDGAYTLTWTVVGSDGTPITGSVSFLVDPGIAATGLGEAPGATGGVTNEPSSGSSAAAGPEFPAWIVVTVGLVGVVVVAVAIIGFMTALHRNDVMRERLASAGPTVSGREKTPDDDALL